MSIDTSTAGTTLDPKQLGQLLLTDAPLVSRLTAHFSACAAWLQEVSLPRLLQFAFGADEPAGQLLPAASNHIHLGFLVADELPRDGLPIAASAAGFRVNHKSFPSTIMARELGDLLGQRRVPTMIFKAYRTAVHGRTTAIEAFIPDADPAIVRRWIGDGVGAHVGIGLNDVASVVRALDLCMTAGFQLPRFMNGRVVTNAAEDLTAFYADRSGEKRPFRIEFFHSGADASR